MVRVWRGEGVGVCEGVEVCADGVRVRVWREECQQC